MLPKNDLIFLLVASLELFLERTSMGEYCSDLLLELSVEKCWRFPLCLFLPWNWLVFPVAGGRFRRIFFASISHIFCRGRISNAALQNSSSVSLKDYFERNFVFSYLFQQIFHWPVFFIWLQVVRWTFCQTNSCHAAAASLSPSSTFFWTVALGSWGLPKCYIF